MQHIYSGAGAPTTAPTGIGHHYVDTANKRSYLSVGTASVTDWFLVGNATTIQSVTERIPVTSAIAANRHIDLQSLALPGRVVVSMNRVMLYEFDDYNVSTNGTVTRVSFTPTSPEIETGETIVIRYEKTI